MDHYRFTFFGAAIAFFKVLLTFWGTVITFFSLSSSRNWASTQGMITSIALGTIDTRQATSVGGHFDYKVNLSYHYQVDDTQYVGHVIVAGLPNVFKMCRLLGYGYFYSSY